MRRCISSNEEVASTFYVIATEAELLPTIMGKLSPEDQSAPRSVRAITSYLTPNPVN